MSDKRRKKNGTGRKRFQEINRTAKKENDSKCA